MENRLSISKKCFWLFIINMPLFWLAGLGYFIGTLAPQHGMASLYAWISFFPHFAFLALITNLIVILFAIIWPNKKFIITTGIVLNTFVLVNIVIDTITFRLFHFHATWQLFRLIFTSQGRSVLDLRTSDWLIIIFVTCLTLLIQIIVSLLINKKLSLILRYRNWIITSLCCLFLCSLIGNVIYAVSWASYNQDVIEASTHFPLYAHIHSNHFFRKYHLLKVRNIDQFSFANQNSHRRFKYPLRPLRSTKPTKPLNIMVILIDTWRHDMLNQQTSPNIYNFSKKSLVFDNHFSSGNMTAAGVFGFFYGIPSSYWGLILKNKQSPLLINTLQKMGYQTAAFSSAPFDIPYQFNKTVFRSIKDLQVKTPGDSASARDIKITEQMLNFLQQTKKSHKPFFGFIFYDSVHAYDFPKNFPAKFKPYKSYSHAELTNNADPIPYKNLYKNAVLFDDSLINKILIKLKNEGYLKNTIVIISADHGEAFNESKTTNWGHGYTFEPYVTHVPMIIYWPNKQHQIFTYKTTHYDIAPTLLQEAFNISNPTQDYSIGYSLFDNRKRNYIFVDSEQWKFAILGLNEILVINRSGYSFETDFHLKKLHENMNPKMLKYAIVTQSHFFQRS